MASRSAALAPTTRFSSDPVCPPEVQAVSVGTKRDGHGPRRGPGRIRTEAIHRLRRTYRSLVFLYFVLAPAKRR